MKREAYRPERFPLQRPCPRIPATYMTVAIRSVHRRPNLSFIGEHCIHNNSACVLQQIGHDPRATHPKTAKYSTSSSYGYKPSFRVGIFILRLDVESELRLELGLGDNRCNVPYHMKSQIDKIKYTISLNSPSSNPFDTPERAKTHAHRKTWPLKMPFGVFWIASRVSLIPTILS